MRPPSPRPAARRAAALLAALASLTGCSRDLALPPEAAGPRLTGLAPARAHAGELLELQGSGFADDPAANRVDFPRASAQGLARTAAGLLVRVPPDAGSGPVTVTTSRGASAPFAGLEYLGLGQLRAGQVVQAVALRHRPRALFALDQDPVLDSSLYRGLVGTGASPWVAPHAFQRPAAGGGSLYFADEAPRLVRWVPGAGEAAALPVAESPNGLVHVLDPAGSRLVTITADPAGDRIATYDAATLAPVMASTLLGLVVQSDPVDVGDGRFAVIAEDGLGALTLALVDPLGAAPVVTLLAAPAEAVQRQPAVLAAGVAGGALVVAVALDGGRIGLADVSPAPAWRAAAVATAAATPVAALAIAGDAVLAAKPDDGVVLGIDAAAAAVAWALEAARPTALAAGPGGVAWAAGDADNGLVALDPARGVLLGRRGADPLATADSLLAGAAWQPAGAGGPAFAFPVARPPALVRWPAGGDPEALVQPLSPALVAFDPGAAGLWTGDASGVSLDGAAPIGVPGGVGWIGASPAGLLTLGDPPGALGVVQGGVPRPLADDLDAPISAPALASDGRLLAVGSMGLAERARLWSDAALAAAGAPELDVVLPGFALQGTFVDGRPWVTWLDDATFEARSARLDATGALADEVAGAIPEGLRSPNGRTAVVAEPGLLGAGLTALRVVALEPAAGFPTIDLIELPAAVVGMAFDGTGERLYVVTREPDQVLVLE